MGTSQSKVDLAKSRAGPSAFSTDDNEHTAPKKGMFRRYDPELHTENWSFRTNIEQNQPTSDPSMPPKLTVPSSESGQAFNLDEPYTMRSDRLWGALFRPTRAGCSAAPPPPPPALPAPGSPNAPPDIPPSEAESSPPPPEPDSIKEAAEMVSAVPNPGPYEQASSDAKRLVMLDTFDGFRCDITKQLAPGMIVNHSFWLGTSMLPDGRNKSYTFLTQVADPISVLMARVDLDRGSVDGRIQSQMLGGLAMGRLQMGLTGGEDGGNDQCMADIDFGGLTWTGNLKYGSAAGGIVIGMNYLQSITPRLAMGGEGIFVSANQNLMSNYVLRYIMPAKSGNEEEDKKLAEGRVTGIVSPTDMASSTLVATIMPAQGSMVLNYKRLVTPNRVSLGAQLECSLAGDSSVLLGAEFNLTRSKVAVCVDGNGKIQSSVEAKLGRGAAPKLQFAADVDFNKDIMRFGYGITIES